MKNKKPKILIIFGTRPEVIKLAPVIRVLKQANHYELLLCNSAQHREMLDKLCALFAIKPDIDLDIMTPGQSLFQITTAALGQLEKVLKEHAPDLVIAQGDTTTVMCSALAAFYAKVPFGHVEAGLRTFNKYDPYPEEINRQMVSQLASLHFAPTELAKEHLRAEKIPLDTIYVTGNTVIDALFYTRAYLKEHAVPLPILKKLDPEKRLLLLTAHRRENHGQPLVNICRAVKALVQAHQDIQVLYPVHPNPRVQETVEAELTQVERVTLCSPLDYLSFVAVMDRAYLILTDSGGVQEEAPSLGKPVLVLRQTTERPEAITAGTVRLIGTQSTAIINNASELLEDRIAYDQMAKAHNPYGDGQAAERISTVLQERLPG